MKDRVLLLAALVGLGLLSSIHAPRTLGLALAAVLILSGRDAPVLLKRAACAVLLFSGAVSIVHAAVVLRSGGDPLPWLVSTNLRVLTMTSLTLLVARRVDLVQAAGCSRPLQFVVVLALAQIAVLRRLVRDFALALRSRGVDRPGLQTAVRYGGAVGAALLLKADHDATTVTQAMTSRGFFNDADQG